MALLACKGSEFGLVCERPLALCERLQGMPVDAPQARFHNRLRGQDFP
jgi:hypothetical protein